MGTDLISHQSVSNFFYRCHSSLYDKTNIRVCN